MLYYGRIFESRELKIITGVLITQVAPFVVQSVSLEHPGDFPHPETIHKL